MTGAVDHPGDGTSAPDAERGERGDRPVDRSHNRDTLSSEAMTEMLRDLQDSMLALDERLGRLESAQGHGASETRRLAMGVADMGDALARRMRRLETGRPEPGPMAPAPRAPVRRPPRRGLAWGLGLGLALLLAIALAGFWLIRAETLDHATVATAPAPVVAAPAPPPPAPTPAPDKKSDSAQPLVRKPAHGAPSPHHPTPTHVRTSTSASAPSPANSPPGFAHYGPNTATGSAPPTP